MLETVPTEDEASFTEDEEETVSTEDDMSEYGVSPDSSERHELVPGGIVSANDHSDQESNIEDSDGDAGEDEDDEKAENVILALNQAAKAVREAAAQAANAIESAAELLGQRSVPKSKRRLISTSLLDFDIPKAGTRKGGRHRQWLPEDRRQLARMKGRGMTDEQVAEALERSASAVSQQWRKQRMQ